MINLKSILNGAKYVSSNGLQNYLYQLGVLILSVMIVITLKCGVLQECHKEVLKIHIY